MRKRSAPRASRTPRCASTRSTSCQLGGKAADQVRRDEYNQHGRSGTDDGQVDQGHPLQPAQGHRQADRQAAAQARRGRDSPTSACTARSCSTASCATSTGVPREAAERLDAWLAWASRSRLKPFIKLARTIRKHKAGVLAAIELGISNGRLEALNSKVRLLSHRAYGFHSADALIAMIYLCCAGIQIALPHR